MVFGSVSERLDKGKVLGPHVPADEDAGTVSSCFHQLCQQRCALYGRSCLSGCQDSLDAKLLQLPENVKRLAAMVESAVEGDREPAAVLTAGGGQQTLNGADIKITVGGKGTDNDAADASFAAVGQCDAELAAEVYGTLHLLHLVFVVNERTLSRPYQDMYGCGRDGNQRGTDIRFAGRDAIGGEVLAQLDAACPMGNGDAGIVGRLTARLQKEGKERVHQLGFEVNELRLGAIAFSCYRYLLSSLSSSMERYEL